MPRTLYIAQYDGYSYGCSYDGVALGETGSDAVRALIEKWDRAFPDNEMTAQDWRDSIRVSKIAVGDALIY